MDRHPFLRGLHRRVKPRNYFEVGVNSGRSLALSRVPSVAVDPAYEIRAQIRCDAHLVRKTSDDFFADPDPFTHLRGGRNPLRNLRGRRPLLGIQPDAVRLDLAFIDGMHQFEFALRDFMNTERFTEWWSVVVFDDMLPRNAAEAARDRQTKAWAGDVFKIIPVLQRYRPDLVVIPVDTAPTGVIVVLGADRSAEALRSHYDEIVRAEVVPDPQQVPPEVISRERAVDPDALLASPLWRDLVRARRLRRGREAGMRMIRRHLATVPLARSR